MKKIIQLTCAILIVNATMSMAQDVTNVNSVLKLNVGKEGQTAPVTNILLSGPNAPGANTPYGVATSQEIKWQFTGAGSSLIRSYRGGSWDTHLQFLTNPAVPIGDNPQVRLHINGDGNVGIGTTNPTEKLNIFHNGGSTPFGAMGIDVTSFSTTSNAADSYYFRVRDIGAGNYIPFIIKGTGNVGIGTTTPSVKLEVAGDTKIGGNVNIGATIMPSNYKLAVAGDVIAERVVVKLQASWPDYVFSPNYQRASLTDVEKYILQNNHLPNVPSAKEVADKGIDVGAMNTKLMEKVEELTLYLIEQNKRMEALEKKNDSLEKAIQQLKK